MIENKTDLRLWTKSERKLIDTEKISLNLTKKILDSDEYKKSKNIMIFYPLKYELNFIDLAKDETKNFYLPKINNENLLCCPYKYGDTLAEGNFKTLEPVCENVNPKILDMVITPALACDTDNYRLGYGKGYYDRFLKNLDVIKIACIPKKLYINTVYPDKYDIKMDKILVSD